MAFSSIPRLLALHGLRVRGMARAEDLADYVGLDPATAESLLDEAEATGLVTVSYGPIGGHRLTEEGKVEAARLVRAELEQSGAESAFGNWYEEFLVHNSDLLAICTDWQLRPGLDGPERNDHTDRAYDEAVLSRLRSRHHSARPVLEGFVGLLDRFGGHLRRLEIALSHIDAGDHDYVTKPMFPSYHSSWFELHEDLLATLGRNRDE